MPDDDDEKPAEDSGSLVDFTPFTPTAAAGRARHSGLGLPQSGLGLHFQRIFWGGDPYGADIWNKCETRIHVWVARRELALASALSDK